MAKKPFKPVSDKRKTYIKKHIEDLSVEDKLSRKELVYYNRVKGFYKHLEVKNKDEFANSYRNSRGQFISNYAKKTTNKYFEKFENIKKSKENIKRIIETYEAPVAINAEHIEKRIEDFKGKIKLKEKGKITEITKAQFFAKYSRKINKIRKEIADEKDIPTKDVYISSIGFNAQIEINTNSIVIDFDNYESYLP